MLPPEGFLCPKNGLWQFIALDRHFRSGGIHFGINFVASGREPYGFYFVFQQFTGRLAPFRFETERPRPLAALGDFQSLVVLRWTLRCSHIFGLQNHHTIVKSALVK